MLRRSQTVNSLDAIPTLGSPAVLTIGNFDGVHLGHQAVIQQAVTTGHMHHMPVAAITFRNHPSTVLKPEQQVTPLCTAEYKLKLIEELGVDVIIALTFTSDLAQQSAETFLNHTRHHLPFSHIVLGHDACIGKNREGNQQVMRGLAKQWDFGIQYLPPLQHLGTNVSSTRVRQAIHEGRLDEAGALLGRYPSYYGTVIAGQALGRKIGFPTLNLDVTGLCLPPLGIYAVTVVTDSGRFKGVANLGLAPTVRDDGRMLLESYLFDFPHGRSPHTVEVFLHTFIRPEAKFDSLEALKKQIALDVEQARSHTEMFRKSI